MRLNRSHICMFPVQDDLSCVVVNYLFGQIKLSRLDICMAFLQSEFSCAFLKGNNDVFLYSLGPICPFLGVLNYVIFLFPIFSFFFSVFLLCSFIGCRFVFHFLDRLLNYELKQNCKMVK